MEIQKNTSDGGEQGHSLLFSIMCSIFDKKSTVLSLGDEQGYSLLTSAIHSFIHSFIHRLFGVLPMKLVGQASNDENRCI